MNAPIDLRPRLLHGWLTRSGVSPETATGLIARLDSEGDNASRFAAARAVLRDLNVSPKTTRELLAAYGYWQRELCSREGCENELHAKKAVVIVKSRAFCSPCCALDALGVPV
jgi:hypothetical protein